MGTQSLHPVYVNRCDNDGCFANQTLWDNTEVILNHRKKIKGGFPQRLCPACHEPTTLLREEQAMPFDEEDLDATQTWIQTTLFPR